MFCWKRLHAFISPRRPSNWRQNVRAPCGHGQLGPVHPAGLNPSPCTLHRCHVRSGGVREAGCDGGGGDRAAPSTAEADAAPKAGDPPPARRIASRAPEAPPASPATKTSTGSSSGIPSAPTRTFAPQPNPLRLMETALVAWPSAEGWRVAEDRCPHRGAPLSYGRLEENNTLTCSYHGWQFDPDGSTSYVPTRAKQGCGACLRVHPSKVCAHGLLWVWPVSVVAGSAAEAEAYAKPLPVDHLPDPSCTVTDWTVNRVPIPWASLLENTLDDAHGVHAHHGLAGLDRALARPAHFVRAGETGAGDNFGAWVNISGPLVASDAAAKNNFASTMASWVNSYRFLAPHRTTVRFGPAYRAEGFIVPAAYDETLLVSAAFSTPGPGIGGNIMIGAQRANPFFTALLHRLGTTIVCQDAVLAEADGLDDLRGERWTGERMRNGLTESDGAVIRLRSWLRRSGGPPLMPVKDEVKQWRHRKRLSVWKMHVRDCPTCRRAHDDAEATAKVLLAMSLAAAASGQLPAAIALFLNAEVSRQTALWFEYYDVKFEK